MGLQFSHNYVPHPAAVAAAKNRQLAAINITFWLDVDGWRTVWLHEPHIIPNRIKDDLAIIFYKPVLVVPTIMMSEIDGNIAVSNMALTNNIVTWMRSESAKTVGFKPCNPESEAWLKQKLALAAGMKFREHGFVDKDKIIYTKTP